MRFFLGTTNPYKVRELAAILGPLQLPLEVTDPIDPEEVGTTFEENAGIKAREYARYAGRKLAADLVRKQGCLEEEARTYLRIERCWTISEDSGLVIPALGGLPGPWSARFSDCRLEEDRVIGYSPSGRSREEIDRLNNARVLELMREVRQPYRAAAFVVSLMVADIEGRVLFHGRGEATGWIAKEARGDRGFGYDPIFISPESFGKTWAELDPVRKNLFSHRRRALQEFTAWLGQQLKEGEA
jgi:XTP/dITP diphosphohydrolase